jgi:hypothetical protein
VLADSAYGSGEVLAALKRAEHTVSIKPGQPRPAVAGGFTLDGFVVDEQAVIAICPNRLTRPIGRSGR